MSELDLPAAARRRADGLHGISTLTSTLAAASLVGTGVVVYAVGHHSATAHTATTSTTRVGTAGSGLQSSSNPPTTTGAAPVAATHGS
jgi:hypothetical protein